MSLTRWLMVGLCITACDRAPRPAAFVGATLITGARADPVADAVVVVRNGRIEAVGPRDAVAIPGDAAVTDLAGRTIIPGLINTHGHVGDTRGLESGHYSVENVVEQLGRYARYGVTTVVSLGGDQEAAVPVRWRRDSLGLVHARLFIAGTVVAADDPDSAQALVDRNASMPVDFIKIRVDDNLGTGQKMPAAAYRRVVERARGRGLAVAAHVYYLADAKDVLRAGVDFLAHSVRDRPVDDEFIGLLKERNACYTPTLMREVSTFVYESEPAFFNDPFFLAEADPAVLAALRDPARQARIRGDRAAQTYKRQLDVARANLKRLADAGVRITLGTDTGPPGRFQGYFEQLELEMMVDAGLTPAQVLLAATGDAASCLNLRRVGTLQAGNWADFVVLSANPLENIRNTRTIESVWIGGSRLAGR